MIFLLELMPAPPPHQVSLDDGRHQSVSYVSDKYGGYKAKVAYKDQHSSYTRTK